MNSSHDRSHDLKLQGGVVQSSSVTRATDLWLTWAFTGVAIYKTFNKKRDMDLLLCTCWWQDICYVFIVLAAAGNMILWIFHRCFVEARKKQNIRWGHPSQWCCAHNLLTLLASHWSPLIGWSGTRCMFAHCKNIIVRLSGRLSKLLIHSLLPFGILVNIPEHRTNRKL